ncbi:MAG: hypothetical protein RIC52_08340, partial [Amphiplicatus sp.]
MRAPARTQFAQIIKVRAFSTINRIPLDRKTSGAIDFAAGFDCIKVLLTTGVGVEGLMKLLVGAIAAMALCAAPMAGA